MQSQCLFYTAEEKSGVRADNDANSENNAAADDADTRMQDHGSGEDAAVDDDWSSVHHGHEHIFDHGASRRCQSSADDPSHNCWASCSGSYHGDPMSTTYYVNYEHPAANIVGPAANLELLFLLELDQIASTACFVDHGGAPFVTLLQNAAGAAAASGSALYVDASPRIVELDADDSARLTVGDNTRHDIGPSTDIVKTATLAAGETADEQAAVAVDRFEVGSRHKRCSVERRQARVDAAAARDASPRRRGALADARGSPVNSDGTETRRAGRRRRRRRLDAGTSRHKHPGDTAVQALLTVTSPSGDDVGLRDPPQQQQQGSRALDAAAAAVPREKYSLPDVFVDRKPAAPPARRPEASLGRGVRLPAVKNAQPRYAHAFPAPQQRRRPHPLAPRRPMTPPNRNVLASRAVWPSMASGRAVEDQWTRRAAATRPARRVRLPPIDHAATVATWQ